MIHQQHELSCWQYGSENTRHWKCHNPSKLWWRVKNHYLYPNQRSYVPGLHTNIAGVRKLKQAGCTWDLKNDAIKKGWPFCLRGTFDMRLGKQCT